MDTKFNCKDVDEWNKFVRNGLIENQETNLTNDFPKSSKRFGLAFLSYLEAAYLAKDEMSDEEFCKINGDVPTKFLNRFK